MFVKECGSMAESRGRSGFLRSTYAPLDYTPVEPPQPYFYSGCSGKNTAVCIELQGAFQ
jgi:hypothetical protein